MRERDSPQVGLSGGYDYLQDRYLAHDGQWVVVLGVKWNAFDGGSSRNRGKAIEFQAAALSEQRSELASVIQLQVIQSWIAA